MNRAPWVKQGVPASRAHHMPLAQLLGGEHLGKLVGREQIGAVERSGALSALAPAYFVALLGLGELCIGTVTATGRF